jgi:WD40 repeat protein
VCTTQPSLTLSPPCLPFALTIVCLVCVCASSGTVNEVAFHPDEPIIASCSSDKKIYLGEIEP